MSLNTIFYIIEVPLLMAGVGLLFWLFKSEAGRRAIALSRITRWHLPAIRLLQSLILIAMGIFVMVHLTDFILKITNFSGLSKGVVDAFIWEAGIIIGLVASWFLCFRDYRSPVSPAAVSHSKSILAGIITFLISIPLVTLAGFLWTEFLGLFGYQPESQPLIKILLESKQLSEIAILSFFAVMLAPVCEELIFRAGLYRWMRFRFPILVALLLPTTIFALLHQNPIATLFPLLTLAIILSLAYEHTGRIAVPIIAHALFNAHSIAMVFIGAS